MATEPSTRMKFKLQPGVERGDFVGQDVAPALLSDKSYIQAAGVSFAPYTVTAGTGVFSGGLVLPVAVTGAIAPVTGTIFYDTVSHALSIFVGGATGWVNFVPN
jgi:hypothetical protein